MNRLLTTAFLAALMMLAVPASQAGETKFSGVAPPRAEHSGHRYYRNYDRYRHDRRSHRSYRTNRQYSRYRYRPHSDYVYRPLRAPARYSYYGGYSHYPRYHYYPRHHGDGLFISPYGVTIFLDLSD